jgi:hypothetical protein
MNLLYESCFYLYLQRLIKYIMCDFDFVWLAIEKNKTNGLIISNKIVISSKDEGVITVT